MKTAKQVYTSIGLLWIGTLVWAPLGAQTATEVVLHHFSSLDGTHPKGGVISDAAGNLYGTTTAGGTSGAGVVYKLDNSHNYTVLYDFTGGTDGREPSAGVIADSAGNLYGTTVLGGAANAGVVFKLDATGKETVLYSFSGGTDGAYPSGSLILDSANNLYGTTTEGGQEGTGCCGVVFMLNPAGQETVMHTFKGLGIPAGSLIRNSAGQLYGTAEFNGVGALGSVFELDPSGDYTQLFNFGMNNGGFPLAGVVRDPAGNLYGTTSGGGTANMGVVYRLNTSNQETVLHNFTGGADGSDPNYAGVTLDSAGNLYGTTFTGGASGAGVVYKLNAKGHETVLYTFKGEGDGGNPLGGVILGTAGKLYGTTYYGGKNKDGVIFEIERH